MDSEVERLATGRVPAKRSALGLLALAVGLIDWYVAMNPPSERHVGVDWREVRIYEAVVFGVIATVAVVMGAKAAISTQQQWVGWIAVGIGACLVVRSVAQIIIEAH